jgi:hypothetical protein
MDGGGWSLYGRSSLVQAVGYACLSLSAATFVLPLWMVRACTRACARARVRLRACVCVRLLACVFVCLCVCVAFADAVVVVVVMAAAAAAAAAAAVAADWWAAAISHWGCLMAVWCCGNNRPSRPA